MKSYVGCGSKEMITVIIIICMILVVMVPSILNLIEFSDKKVLINNVITFRNEVDKSLLQYTNGGDSVENGCYYVTYDGNICLSDYDSSGDVCSGDTLKIDLEGEKPFSGVIDISENKVTDIHNIRVDHFFVNVDDTARYYISDEPVAQLFCRK